MRCERIDLPARLLRFYTFRKYAEAFAYEGRLRLWRIEYYRNIEDSSRSDSDEGVGRLLVPGRVPTVNVSLSNGTFTDSEPIEGHFNLSTTWMQPTYLYCTCLPEVSSESVDPSWSELMTISDPALFFDELARAMARMDLQEREVISVEGFPVRYDKDAISALPDDEGTRLRLAYGQKPYQFERQREYRFAVSLSGPSVAAPEFLDIQLPQPHRFCAVRG